MSLLRNAYLKYYMVTITLLYVYVYHLKMSLDPHDEWLQP